MTRQFTIDYVPPANPCFLAIAPPLTIPNFVNNLSDPDVLVDVNVTFDPVYPQCLYDVSLAVSKDLQPDTIANVITFTPMTGATIAELGFFNVGLLAQSYDASYQGVYTLDVSYSWYEPWLIVTRTFTWTLNDPCPAAISTPASFANLNLTLQKADSQ